MATAVLAREMVNNLIDNAIHHAGAGATATVSVRIESGSAVLAVDDDGVGVAEDDRPGLFEQFRRGRNVAGRRAAASGCRSSPRSPRCSTARSNSAAPSGGKGFGVVVSAAAGDATASERPSPGAGRRLGQRLPLAASTNSVV